VLSFVQKRADSFFAPVQDEALAWISLSPSRRQGRQFSVVFGVVGMEMKRFPLGAFAKRICSLGLCLAVATAIAPPRAHATATAPIVFKLSARGADTGKGEPSVTVAMKNVADDEYAFYANAFLIVERKGSQFLYPLVIAKKIPPIYVSVPPNRTLYLVARPAQGIVEVIKSVSWDVLLNFREAYGAGTYRMKYCSQLAEAGSFVCSNTVSVKL
jgi:hypothetical protein